LRIWFFRKLVNAFRFDSSFCSLQQASHTTYRQSGMIVRFLSEIKWFKAANYQKNGCSEPWRMPLHTTRPLFLIENQPLI
jgi:hypothetical protein